ncbi:helix-turn-helix DNA-binding domain protein [Streptomyces phage Faust]|uniref:Helix-turn-helix DNA-binding domain protein n=1 Tax=Streptomyces phage Faust TaxID=2767565 RepID=A0A7G9UYS5_9CAUD|nr:HNH endonuclease [Streptomyces phage Faust]QNN99180.1 helix-turn-helix DNA-binding domain protein [Streptomyces phage Faust]
MSAKKYRSEKWLRKRYVIERKSIDDIAEECGVSKMTISRALSTFKITRL